MSEPSEMRGATRAAHDQPIVHAGDLRLRPWVPDDALQLVKAFGDPAIRAWHQLPIESLEDAEDWMTRWHDGWHRRTAVGWAITRDSRPDAVLGQVALRALYLDDGMAELSYWVIPDYRGEGIAPRAAAGLSEWAFGELKLNRLEIVHSVRNRESCRVALKAGFTPEGIKRSLQRHEHGGVHDMHLHARVRPAETRARLRDRALLDVVSHVPLWTTASMLSAGLALLALVYRFAAVLPLLAAVGVLAVRSVAVHQPYRRHRRRLAVRVATRR